MIGFQGADGTKTSDKVTLSDMSHQDFANVFTLILEPHKFED